MKAEEYFKNKYKNTVNKDMLWKEHYKAYFDFAESFSQSQNKKLIEENERLKKAAIPTGYHDVDKFYEDETSKPNKK